MISAVDILQGKVLIVDDKKANILLLERMLRGAGYDAKHTQAVTCARMSGGRISGSTIRRGDSRQRRRR